MRMCASLPPTDEIEGEVRRRRCSEENASHWRRGMAMPEPRKQRAERPETHLDEAIEPGGRADRLEVDADRLGGRRRAAHAATERVYAHRGKHRRDAEPTRHIDKQQRRGADEAADRPDPQQDDRAKPSREPARKD